MLWRECDFIRPIRGTGATIAARHRVTEIASKSQVSAENIGRHDEALPTQTAKMWRNKWEEDLFPPRCLQFNECPGAPGWVVNPVLDAGAMPATDSASPVRRGIIQRAQ
jgi:hypothetical protein